MPLRFGDDSFHAHLVSARRFGIEPAVIHLKGLGRDIDLPADLKAFLRCGQWTRTRGLLEMWGGADILLHTRSTQEVFADEH